MCTDFERDSVDMAPGSLGAVMSLCMYAERNKTREDEKSIMLACVNIATIILLCCPRYHAVYASTNTHLVFGVQS